MKHEVYSEWGSIDEEGKGDRGGDKEGRREDVLEVTPNDCESVSLERFSVRLIAFHQCLDWNYVRAELQTNIAPLEMGE